MTQWIKEFGDNIEVVFSNNDVMALGAIHAINSNSDLIRKPMVVGVDGIKEAIESIKNGDMKGTVISDAKAQAQAILDISMSVSQGTSLENISDIEEGKYKKLPHTKVTINNVDEYLE